MEKIVLITTTADNREVLESIGKSLVEDRLIACAQIGGPIESIYRWKGTVETATEWMLVTKTRASLYSIVENKIKTFHPYEVPEITAVTLETGLAAYVQWVIDETG